jgi:uncharacterized protein YbcV (DUF1398 family)
MFTLNQIKEAHSKVKSGADFPGYVQELVLLGVNRYNTFVAEGRTIYYGKNGYEIQSDAKYSTLVISQHSNKNLFSQTLKAHQEGKTDYPTFCRDCSKSGIEKWVVDLSARTCTYYDTRGKEIVVESIPEPKI